MQAIWCLLPTVNLPPIRARRPGSIVITFTRKFPGSFTSLSAIRARLQRYFESGATPGSPFNPAGPGGPAGPCGPAIPRGSSGSNSANRARWPGRTLSARFAFLSRWSRRSWLSFEAATKR
jgi:hypothetical protein